MKLFLSKRSSLCALLFAWIGCVQVVHADIAYLAYSDDGYWQVWWMNDEGDQSRQLTHTAYDKNSVSWFPDGQKLLVNGIQGGLSTVGVKDGKEESLSLPLTLQGFTDAVLSPDGSKMAFSYNAAEDADDNNVWMVNFDGSNLKRLTNDPGLQHEPRWSPDGKFVYFLNGKGQQNHDIFQLDISSGKAKQLTASSLYNFDVTSKKDGALAFSSNRRGGYDIWLRSAAGAESLLIDDPVYAASPSWSPDGKYLVFESLREAPNNIWLFDVGKKTTKRLTHHASGARKPIWFNGSVASGSKP